MPVLCARAPPPAGREVGCRPYFHHTPAYRGCSSATPSGGQRLRLPSAGRFSSLRAPPSGVRRPPCRLTWPRRRAKLLKELAEVVELVDALRSGRSGASPCGGSNPPFGTRNQRGGPPCAGRLFLLSVRLLSIWDSLPQHAPLRTVERLDDAPACLIYRAVGIYQEEVVLGLAVLEDPRAVPVGADRDFAH